MNTSTLNSTPLSNPRAAFNLVLCGLTSIMAALFIGAASLTPADFFVDNSAAYIILLAVSLGAIFLSSLTKSTWVSLISALVIPLAMGAMWATELASMPTDLMGEVLALVALNALVMFALSIVFPDFFKKIHGILVGALIALIAVSVLSIFFFDMNMTLYHLATIAIFSGLLGYDFVQAREVEPNLRNAISLSISLFLDLLNLAMAWRGLQE